MMYSEHDSFAGAATVMKCQCIISLCHFTGRQLLNIVNSLSDESKASLASYCFQFLSFTISWCFPS